MSFLDFHLHDSSLVNPNARDNRSSRLTRIWAAGAPGYRFGAARLAIRTDEVRDCQQGAAVGEFAFDDHHPAQQVPPPLRAESGVGVQSLADVLVGFFDVVDERAVAQGNPVPAVLDFIDCLDP